MEMTHHKKQMICERDVTIICKCPKHNANNNNVAHECVSSTQGKNKFVDELLSLLHLYLLPNDNCLPSNMYQEKVLTNKVGLRHNNIHAYNNGCVFFWKDYEGLQACPKCGSSQYEAFGKSQVPMKVVKHFPLTT